MGLKISRYGVGLGGFDAADTHQGGEGDDPGSLFIDADGGSIWDSLPMHGAVQTWGREVYFRTSISRISSRMRAPSSAGAKSPSGRNGDAITIRLARLPFPKAQRPIHGNATFGPLSLDDVDQLKGVAGEEITIIEAELAGPGWQSS